MSFFNRYAECCKLKGVAPMSPKAADTIGCFKSTISAFETIKIFRKVILLLVQQKCLMFLLIIH